MDIVTNSTNETKKLARMLAEEIGQWHPRGARVIALVGDLGAGKTTFVQGFARALGIKEVVHSPTFLILKIYEIRDTKYEIRHLIHIDCYRIESSKELLHLGFKELLKDKDAIMLVEWADKIRSLLPHDTLWIECEYGKYRSERMLKLKTQKSKVKTKTENKKLQS